ncbi:MAG: hypothetical protein ACTSXT_13520 [Candidatus Helarchaeota archaeon]
MSKTKISNKRTIEIYLSNGLFENVLNTCILRNNTIRLVIENKIVHYLKKLGYFKNLEGINIETLAPHEIQRIPKLKLTEILENNEQQFIRIRPDFIIKIMLKNSSPISIPAEIESKISSHLYWQTFLYTNYIIYQLRNKISGIDYILTPPFFVIYLFGNKPIQKNLISRFRVIFIDLYKIELKIKYSDINLSLLYLKGKLSISQLLEILADQSLKDPILFRARKKFILCFIHNKLDNDKKEKFIEILIKKQVITMTEVEDWKRELLSTLTLEDAKYLSLDIIEGLTHEQVKKLTPKQLKELTPEQLKELTPEQLKELTPEQLKELTPEQLKIIIKLHKSLIKELIDE